MSVLWHHLIPPYFSLNKLRTLTCCSLNECYFANKGAAVVLGGTERGCTNQWRSPARALPQPDIQHHLQSMFYLLRPEETLKMVIALNISFTNFYIRSYRNPQNSLLRIFGSQTKTVLFILV